MSARAEALEDTKVPMSLRSGLVLSGGGADGAYEVGVVKALAEGRSPATDFRPLEADVVTGTSAGAFNAAFLVGRSDERLAAAAHSLEQCWLSQLADNGCGSGSFRLRADPTGVLDPRCLFPSPLASLTRLAQDAAFLARDGVQRAGHFLSAREPLTQRALELVNLSSFVNRDSFERTVREVINYRAVRRSNVALRLAATNWATGRLHLFSNRDLTEETGPLVVLGSSAIPGFFPPSLIGAEPYVDGGVLMNTPLRPAIRAGAEVLHVVYLDPDIEAIPLAHLANTLETFYRSLSIAWAAAVNDDIGDAALVNRSLEILRRLRGGEQPRADEDLVLLRALGRLEGKLSGEQRYRPLTIHRFHPRDDLGGALGYLNLDPLRMSSLIERGFEDAQKHDCRDSGCLLPPGQEGPSAARVAA